MSDVGRYNRARASGWGGDSGLGQGELSPQAEISKVAINLPSKNLGGGHSDGALRLKPVSSLGEVGPDYRE